MQSNTFKDIDQYIAAFPRDVQQILKKIRATIKKAAPDAEEAISYQMPTFKLKGNLIHFAAFKSHIGIYPMPSATEKFKKQLSRYQGGKGSIRLPLDEPIPYELIDKITKFRVKQNLEKAKTKNKR
jgi:uncharacterized protein YdhG (YjbR/CyaY superfamily)